MAVMPVRRGKFWLDPVIRLDGTVGSAPGRRARDSSSNLGAGDLKLII